MVTLGEPDLLGVAQQEVASWEAELWALHPLPVERLVREQDHPRGDLVHLRP